MKRIPAALALLGAALAALPGAAAAEKYRIGGETWGYFQEYLRKIDHGHKPRAFAITTDGYGAWYIWCEATRCMPGVTYSQDALNGCARDYDTDCVVFAVREKIKVEYEVMGGAPATAPETAATAPALAAPDVARIAVPAAVQAEIEVYLRNTRRAGRVWALAIANDGSRVASASCQSTGGGGYFGGGTGCNLASGSPQEQASRAAVIRCGGPTECRLLYEGAQPKGNVEIVTQ